MVATAYDVAKIRKDFPILHQLVNGKPLCYLDNAASTQRPSIVIETLTDYYRNHHSNVHRGVHTLSQRATDLFDASRRRIQAFLGAEHESEIIFTKGSTEAINLVAHSWGRANLKPGDHILLTQMEHHANIVPWQVVAEATGAEIIVAPIDDSGVLILDEYENLLTERVKLCGVVHVSNSLGTVNPIKWITDKAHKVGAKVLVDGAQACAHVELNMKELGVDFYTLASHKIYGPTGLGALYGRRELLEAMPPYQTGGGMIRSVTFEKTTYAGLPEKFEPGTPNIADAIGLKVALDYLDGIGIKNAADHEH
ncbi:MAG: aminotransferase class V-fold PLP-dependent enzyme, partial [Fimbriimonadaceae bacterium]